MDCTESWRRRSWNASCAITVQVTTSSNTSAGRSSKRPKRPEDPTTSPVCCCAARLPVPPPAIITTDDLLRFGGELSFLPITVLLKNRKNRCPELSEQCAPSVRAPL